MELRTVVLCVFVAKVSAFRGCTGTSASLNAADCAAWQAGYDRMGGLRWTHCSDKRADPCSCASSGRSVTCVSNRIDRVLLYNNNLSGTLPPQWSDFTQIKLMFLKENQLTGVLPPEWSSMTQVTHMHLEDNELSGSLPASWSSMTQITEIALYGNQLSGPLPAQWSSMTQLERLWLFNNQLSGSLPAEWSGMTKITIIDLSKNQLTGVIPKEFPMPSLAGTCFLGGAGNNYTCPLPSGAANCDVTECEGECEGSSKGLRTDCAAWKAGYDALGGSSWTFCSDKRADPCACDIDIRKVICSDGHITQVHLTQNNMTGTLPPEWSSMTHVTIMDLSGSKITGSLPHEWSTMTRMDTMDLSTNKLTGSLPPEWSNMTHVEQMHLYENELTGSIPPEWSNMTQMIGLLLHDNQLSGSLPPEWSTMTRMDILYLQNNQLTGSLPPEWSSMTQIDTMDLSNNELTGSLPAEWSSMAKLRHLQLHNNRFTGVINKTFPTPNSCNLGGTGNVFYCPLPSGAEMCGLFACVDTPKPCTGSSTSLDTTDCAAWRAGYDAMGGSNWHFCDDKRDDPCGCVETGRSVQCSEGKITSVSLRDNNLIGTLPPEWSSMTQVTSMYLERNQLNGSLPPGWSNLAQMMELHLHLNKINGTLPAQWSSMTQLEQMLLHNNQLTGTLPPQWSKLTQLRSIDLWGNQLTGSLPPAWSSMTQVRRMYISDNQLTGSLPAQWSSMTNIRQINLSNNQLTGLLPIEWSSMKQVISMFLNNNKFLSSINDTFPMPSSNCNLGGSGNQYFCPLPNAAISSCGVNNCTARTPALTPSPTPIPTTPSPTPVRVVVEFSNQLVGYNTTTFNIQAQNAYKQATSVVTNVKSNDISLTNIRSTTASAIGRRRLSEVPGVTFDTKISTVSQTKASQVTTRIQSGTFVQNLVTEFKGALSVANETVPTSFDIVSLVLVTAAPTPAPPVVPPVDVESSHWYESPGFIAPIAIAFVVLTMYLLD